MDLKTGQYTDLFEAIHRRFHAAAVLPDIAREIYEGFAGEDAKSVVPRVEYHCDEVSPLDSFGADIEMHGIKLSLISGSIRPVEIKEMIASLRQVFDDCQLVGRNFNGQMMFVKATGPTHQKGTYVGTLEYRILITLFGMAPEVRF